MFGETDYDPIRQYSPVSFDEQLNALGTTIDAGKVGTIYSPSLIMCNCTRNQAYLEEQMNFRSIYKKKFSLAIMIIAMDL